MKREKIACHCRRVTYGEIVDAVAAGAKTFEEVSARTTCSTVAANAGTSSRTGRGYPALSGGLRPAKAGEVMSLRNAYCLRTGITENDRLFTETLDNITQFCYNIIKQREESHRENGMTSYLLRALAHTGESARRRVRWATNGSMR